MVVDQPNFDKILFTEQAVVLYLLVMDLDL